MLAKQISYQVIFNGINKVIGFLTTALIFRIYQLEEIGEYFLLIGVLSIFIAITLIGSDKPLIKYNLKKDRIKENAILKTRIFLSILCYPLFIVYTILFLNIELKISLILLSSTLFLTCISFEYLLLAKKKILQLSIITSIVQFCVFFFFLFSYFYELKPNIVFHQIIISSFLSLIILIYAIAFLDFEFKQIFKAKVISKYYFKENIIIIISIIFISIISAVDFIIANRIFSEYDLGIISGLLRYSLLSYGFLIIINKTLFSYSISSDYSKDFKFESKKTSKIYNLISSIILLLLVYPYLKFVMNLQNFNDILVPAFIITVATMFMPNFFLHINKIETLSKKYSATYYLAYTIGFILIYYLTAVIILKKINFSELYYFFSLIYLSKWILLNLFIIKISSVNSIKS